MPQVGLDLMASCRLMLGSSMRAAVRNCTGLVTHCNMHVYH